MTSLVPSRERISKAWHFRVAFWKQDLSSLGDICYILFSCSGMSLWAQSLIPSARQLCIDFKKLWTRHRLNSKPTSSSFLKRNSLSSTFLRPSKHFSTVVAFRAGLRYTASSTFATAREEALHMSVGFSGWWRRNLFNSKCLTGQTSFLNIVQP